MEAFTTSVEMAEGGCNCIGGVMEDNGSSEAGEKKVDRTGEPKAR